MVVELSRQEAPKKGKCCSRPVIIVVAGFLMTITASLILVPVSPYFSIAATQQDVLAISENNNNKAADHSKSAGGAGQSNASHHHTYTKLIQIGANDGVQGNVEIVKKILNDPKSKAALVEGNPSIFSLLTKNIKEKYDQSLERIVPVNGLVCEKGKRITFNLVDTDKLSRVFLKEELLPHWVRYQISSLDKESTVAGIAHYLKKKGQGHLNNASDFVVEKKMDCISFEQIIDKVRIAAEEVEVLAIDTEGYDAIIMLESFKVVGLLPQIIIFEWKSAIKLYPKEFSDVLDTLKKRGYMFNCEKGEEGWKPCTGGQDVIAWLEKQNKDELKWLCDNRVPRKINITIEAIFGQESATIVGQKQERADSNKVHQLTKFKMEITKSHLLLFLLLY